MSVDFAILLSDCFRQLNKGAAEITQIFGIHVVSSVGISKKMQLEHLRLQVFWALMLRFVQHDPLWT